jgi:hypothetical protein
MNATQTPCVKDQVREAVDMEWAALEARHPNLAGLLDREAVIERAAAHLAGHPDFRQAMDEAAAAGMTAQTNVLVARGFIQDWIARLVF